MYLPRATYRVQLHKDFNFQQLAEVIPYLDRLGISTIYAAPFFKSTPGSMHGYDVLDPLMINPEIGTLDEFRALCKELKARNIGWIQDIVPNHMAFSSDNPWLYDVLEKGPHSPYYRFFDINWLYPEDEFFGKVMVPKLGSPLPEILQAGELRLNYGNQGFYFAYYDHAFPASMRTYVLLTTLASDKLSKHSTGQSFMKDYLSLTKRLDDFIRALPDAEQKVEGWEPLKKELLDLSQKHQQVQDALEEAAEKTSQTPERLEELLDTQFFRLTHWKITEKKINYRRFFTVNDLICLNMQDKRVFNAYHSFIKTLLEEELIQGLRVDHVDGLLDPTTYLEQLRTLAGKDAYIVVEKILEGQEIMPEHWPIEGSSGYDYLAFSNQVLTNEVGSETLLKQYKQFSKHTDYKSLVYRNKSFILQHRMAGELDNLYRLMHDMKIIPYEDTTGDQEKLKEALGHFLVAFPVYRIYANSLPFPEEEMLIVRDTFKAAEQKAPDLNPYFQRLREIFNGVNDKDQDTNLNKLYFTLRSQQFSGPLAAKGVEDTTFYQYFPLISHNEVGDSPEHLGMSAEDFHQRMQGRMKSTMNTTATHDTKRGEDARMRINVLSEIPEAWENKFKAWQDLNQKYLTSEDEQSMPDANDEYFFYQTLIGTFPFHINYEQDDYPQRLEDYLLKAIREAKVHTNWAAPNEKYEKAFTHFARKTLSDQNFLEDFNTFAKDIAQTGAMYSLAQTLLKLTVPGVPDVYQGTEFWDLSMVDPDNRRAVDYPHREQALNQMEVRWQDQPKALLRQLINDVLNPNIKLFTLYQTLTARQQYRPVFDEGEYVPVTVSEGFEQHILAFRRVTPDAEALVVIPLNIRSLETEQEVPIGLKCRKNAELNLENMAGEWHHVFTNQTIKLNANAAVADILAHFPVALLIKA
ncbi:malto-oligosyltrehalose synthase [Catalinimonas niigatensis]|uniref:malto-oligosyltrehalose synthase n=1 Tax=Catalinimonas niigatensis TaxID=1397264 RepID=UPI002665A5C7|nr:malto-oligosyltrehalose synthase [Catalinimonas niigatensis]WPP50879.1 malto-oligosyltrehalose synthase [Catalinimonas niigatensis]